MCVNMTLAHLSICLLIWPLCMVHGVNRRSLKGTSSIVNNDVKYFEFDPYYTKCNLRQSHEGYFIKKYTLQRGDDFDMDILETDTMYLFAALQKETLNKEDPTAVKNGNWIGRAACSKQIVDDIWTGDKDQTGVGISAAQCGLGTMITYLCLVDNHVQGMDIANSLGNAKMDQLAREDCKSLVKFINNSNPARGSKAFLYAAIDACYTKMAVQSMKTKEYKSFDTEAALREFNESIEKGECFLKTYGTKWHFCIPITVKQCCIVC